MKSHMTATLLASAAGLANTMATSHQLCAETNFFEKGNWYCKNVNLITYENVGRVGYYNEVVNMNQQTGACQFAKKAISGPLAPFNEPLSFHFRGPLYLKQFAVYLPNTGRNRVKKLRKRDDNAEQSDSESEISEVSDDDSDKEFVHHDYLSLYEHSEAERKAHSEEESNDQPPAIRRRLRKRNSYTSVPLKDLDKQGRVKKGTTLLQLSDGSVGFWAEPDNDSVILQATADEFQFLWDNVHKLTLKVPPPLPETSFVALEEDQPAASPLEAEHPPTHQTHPVPESQPANNHSHPPQTNNPPNHSHHNHSPPSPNPPFKNPTLENHNPPNTPFSAIHTPNLKNSPLLRTAYYNAPAQHSSGLTFLANYGGQGSGSWSSSFGNTLSYLNSAATSAAPRSELLSNLTLPSGREFALFTDQPCNDSPTCGYIQPGSVTYKGFGHSSPASEPDKLFLLEFSMPHDGSASPEEVANPYSQADMPAVWMLNARIPYTAQYHACSCWTSGCGEFDVLEVLAPGNDKAKSTFHSVFSGGDSNYFARPTGGTITVAVVFDSSAGAVSVKVLPAEGKDFPSWLSVDDIKKYWHEDVGLYGAAGSSAFRIA